MLKLNKIKTTKEITPNYYVADFETTTMNSKYFQEHKKGSLIAWLVQPLGNYETDFHGTDFVGFENWLLSLECPAVIFFHNLSKFDAYVIIAYALERWTNNLKQRKSDIHYSFKKVNGGILSLTVRTPKTVIVFQDSIRLLTLPVATLGAILGYPKLTTDYDIDPVETWEELPEEMRVYLKRDVEIVNKSLIHFKDTIDKLSAKYQTNWNPFKLTSSSLSRDIINFFDPDEMFKISISSQEKSNKYMRGGFTNFNQNYILKNIKDDLVMWDAKSHYPSIMYSKMLPAGEPWYYEDLAEFKELFLKKQLPNYEVIFVYVKGRIKKSLNGWSAIPKKGDLDNYHYVPEDDDIEFEFGGLVQEWEIMFKFYEFHEWEFIEVPYWEQGQQQLKSVIQDLYHLKETEKNNQGYKIILNSIYGSCAMKHTYGEEWYFAKHETPKVSFIQDKRTFHYIQKKQENFYWKTYDLYEYEEEQPRETPCWNKWIAAAITSWGRYILLEKISRDPDNVLYGDTDSLLMFKRANIFYEGEQGKQLTQWDIDKDNIDSALILGPKRYFLYNNNKPIKHSFAGVSKKYWDSLSYEEIESLFKQETIILADGQMRKVSKSEYNFFPFLEKIDYVDNLTMRRLKCQNQRESNELDGN